MFNPRRTSRSAPRRLIVLDRANFPHAVGDNVGAGYRRGNLLQKRRQLMEAWARFCATKRIEAEVVPFSGRANLV
jgi:hypothetical protein